MDKQQETEKAIDKPTKEWNDQELMMQEVLNELTHLRASATNRVVVKLQSGLINIMKNIQVPSHSALIKVLLDEQIEAGASLAAATASEEEGAVGGQFYPILSKPQPIKSPKLIQSTSSMAEAKQDNRLHLSLFSSEVHWNDDKQFVYFQLPIFQTEKLAFEDVKCSLIHLELGHRLKVEYPGVTFSVLINQPGIKGTVEGKIEADIICSKLNIRLAKSSPYSIWDFVTILTADATHLYFNLEPNRLKSTHKTTELMMLILEKRLNGKNSAQVAGLQELAKKLFNQPSNLQATKNRDIKYKVKEPGFVPLCKCQCDTCEIIRTVQCGSDDSDDSEGEQLKRKLENRKQYFHGPSIKANGLCDVWWQNDLNYAYICLKQRTSGEQVKLVHRKTPAGYAVRVTYSATTFTTVICHQVASDDSVQVELKDDLIVIRVKKGEKVPWPYITPIVEDEDGNRVYHFNPFYHVRKNMKNKKSDQADESPIQQSQIDHLINNYKFNRLTVEEKMEIFDEIRTLHYLEGPPTFSVVEKRRFSKPKISLGFIRH